MPQTGSFVIFVSSVLNRSSNQSSVPAKTGPDENELKRRLSKVLPFLQNEKQPGAEQSCNGSSDDDAPGNL